MLDWLRSTAEIKRCEVLRCRHRKQVNLVDLLLVSFICSRFRSRFYKCCMGITAICRNFQFVVNAESPERSSSRSPLLTQLLRKRHGKRCRELLKESLVPSKSCCSQKFQTKTFSSGLSADQRVNSCCP